MWGDIYSQRFNSSGATQGIDFKVNDDPASSLHSSPSMAVDREGNFAIAGHFTAPGFRVQIRRMTGMQARSAVIPTGGVTVFNTPFACQARCGRRHLNGIDRIASQTPVGFSTSASNNSSFSAGSSMMAWAINVRGISCTVWNHAVEPSLA